MRSRKDKLPELEKTLFGCNIALRVVFGGIKKPRRRSEGDISGGHRNKGKGCEKEGENRIIKRLDIATEGSQMDMRK